MRLKKIDIENFRCFQAISIDFNALGDKLDGMTVLVAQNAEGKTAVLDAIDIVLGPFLIKLTDEKDKYVIDSADNHRLPNGDIEGYATIDAVFLNPESFVKKYGYQDFHVKRYFDGLRNNTQTDAQYHLTNLAKFIFDWRNGGDPWPIMAYYGDQRLWKSLSKKDESEPMLAQDRLAGYKDARKPAIGYIRCLRWMKELDLALFGEQKKKDSGDSSYNPETLEKLQCFMLLMKKALREVMAPSGYTEFNFNVSKNDLEVWGKEHPARIEVSRMSAGIRIVLGMVSDMVYRCCLLNPRLKDRILEETPGIVLIDEIELHLHPSWQQQILPTLQRIFPKIQFIVTTHSPQVISSVPKECVRIIDGGHVVPFDTQTQGVESQDILAQIFGTNPAPDADEFVVKLNRYAEMEATGLAETYEGRQLYQELVRHFGESYSPLQRIETHRRFMARRREGGTNHA